MIGPRLALAIFGASLTMLIGALAWNFAPPIGALGLRVFGGGPHFTIARLVAQRDDLVRVAADWKAAAGGWEASFRASEALRATETSQARVALQDASLACDARVASARRSALAIQSLINKEPRRDPQGCPLRELVGADELRDALQPAAR